MPVVAVVVSLYLCNRNSVHNYNCYCVMTISLHLPQLNNHNLNVNMLIYNDFENIRFELFFYLTSIKPLQNIYHTSTSSISFLYAIHYQASCCLFPPWE